MRLCLEEVGSVRFEVTDEDTAIALGSGDVPVLATGEIERVVVDRGRFVQSLRRQRS